MRHRDLPFWPAVACLLALGVGCVVVSTAVHLPRVPHDLILAVGTALIIAAVLAATVDQWLKQRLLRDAFKELFGWLLPEQLREELSWVYEQPLLCDRHELILRLTEADDDLLTLRMESHRDVRNITSHMIPWRPIFAVDEWFYTGRPSQVISMRISRGAEIVEGELVLPGAPFSVAMQSPDERCDWAPARA
jgi:hypothetical protein